VTPAAPPVPLVIWGTAQQPAGEVTVEVVGCPGGLVVTGGQVVLVVLAGTVVVLVVVVVVGGGAPAHAGSCKPTGAP
jgi:hypothetical protein